MNLKVKIPAKNVKQCLIKKCYEWVNLKLTLQGLYSKLFVYKCFITLAVADTTKKFVDGLGVLVIVTNFYYFCVLITKYSSALTSTSDTDLKMA